jgi:hypothetical protein
MAFGRSRSRRSLAVRSPRERCSLLFRKLGLNIVRGTLSEGYETEIDGARLRATPCESAGKAKDDLRV